MKRIRLILSLLFATMPLFVANGIKFKVEELSKPENLLSTTSSILIYPNICGRGSGDVNVLATSNMPENLVSYGYHSFFNGMYSAYAEHRPFVLSPDMIWLLISQGFAQHVSANSEALRPSLVNFDGKMMLVVRNDSLKLNSPASEWEKAFPDLTKQMETYTSPGLVNLLTSDFSTTTPVERIASQITIMDALENYFEYVIITRGCGIPEITLKGTSEDWQSIYDRTKKLAAYDLAWWTDELEPILKQFIDASKGNVDVKFWINMFKYHSQKKYGAPNAIDGWIVTFFPYDKNGKRNDFKQLDGSDKLPEEIVKVDLNYIEIFLDGKSKTTPLELWAGFIGLDQNETDYTLTPVIGWMVRKKNEQEIKSGDVLKQTIMTNNGDRIAIRVKEIPAELLTLPAIDDLSITFIGKIMIPDELKHVRISRLSLNGEIAEQEIGRISKLIPSHTKLIINGEYIPR